MPTPPYDSSSSGANIHGSSFGGQRTSSSAKTVMLVWISPKARTICRRLLGYNTLRIFTLEVPICLTISCARVKFASMVTKMISNGSVARMLRIVSRSTSPSPSIEGMTTVTSCDVNRGISGMGIGRSLLKANKFTTRRRYRYRLTNVQSASYEAIREGRSKGSIRHTTVTRRDCNLRT